MFETVPIGSLQWLALAVCLLLIGLVLGRLMAQRRLPPQNGVPPAPGDDRRLRTLLANSSDLLLLLNADGTLRYSSPSVRRVLGHDEQRLWAPSFLEFVHPDDVRAVHALLKKAGQRASGETLRGECRFKSSSCTWLYVEIVVTNHLADPEIGGLLLNIRDVTERKALEEELLHQARHDALTGLANGTMLREHIERALGRVGPGRGVGLLFLDVDDFKQVNDSLGHAAGDRLLQEVALRLQASSRAGDTVARLGGDEFAVLVEDAEGEDMVVAVAQRILEELRLPYAFLAGRIRPSTSIGVALLGAGGTSEELLHRADVAMYAAKARGKDDVCTFRPELDEPLKERLRLQTDLRAAIRDWHLNVFYQPIVSLESRAIAGVEALLRWNHPSRGLLGADEFLGIAEKSGQMPELGAKVLLESCQEVAGWRSVAGRDDFFLSVNVSKAELRHSGLPGAIQAALEASDLPADRLVLEISESALVGREKDLADTLTALTERGMRLAIDDFGTHYSSLAFLEDLPISFLKLDKTFVAELSINPKSFHIVRVMADLSETFGVQMIAEGIELDTQHEALLELGCSFGQGLLYLPARPCYEVRTLLLGEETLTASAPRVSRLDLAFEPDADESANGVRPELPSVLH